MKYITKTELKCPECSFIQEAEMPTDTCQFFYECVNCKTMLKPNKGDCCVFCSYADQPCPPKQLEKKGQSRDWNCEVSSLKGYSARLVQVCNLNLNIIAMRWISLYCSLYTLPLATHYRLPWNTKSPSAKMPKGLSLLVISDLFNFYICTQVLRTAITIN